MPIPAPVARFNRVVTNRVTKPFAGRLPGFAVVRHRGRKSGRAYATPVNIFRHGDRYVAALTYGPDCDWVRNVVAAGECELDVRGRTVRLTEPEIVHDPTRAAVPPAVRPILAVIGVTDFLHLKAPPGR
ncbi:nitroreductase family deazaflavin-dependent oxidoreductase [Spirillospora sp. CA-294931]|uniref:nitroreductase family deazaflavin-dependent oxidoreductase n=1 Tax=Spirillospora sp. CA-294931 TaxID=3240042 RepID=UPI003D91E001